MTFLSCGTLFAQPMWPLKACVSKGGIGRQQVLCNASQDSVKPKRSGVGMSTAHSTAWMNETKHYLDWS